MFAEVTHPHGNGEQPGLPGEGPPRQDRREERVPIRFRPDVEIGRRRCFPRLCLYDYRLIMNAILGEYNDTGRSKGILDWEGESAQLVCFP